jgi:hypothetical protein
MKAKRYTLSVVPPDPRAVDWLAAKLDEVAEHIADALVQDGLDIHEKVDGLKALSAYYQATRGKSAPAPSRNAFAEYRNAQGQE